MGFVRFETLPDFNDGDYGFDDTDSRGAWQMVPLGGAKYLRLKVVGASVASIESDNIGIASVTSAEKELGYKNVYRIDGKAKGSGFHLRARFPKGSAREASSRGRNAPQPIRPVLSRERQEGEGRQPRRCRTFGHGWRVPTE